MKLVLKSLLVAVFFMLFNSAYAALPSYTLLNPAQPASSKKIEVLEFFFYECPHCFHLHNELIVWEKTMPADIDLEFMPTIFRDSTEPLARTYFVLKSMGKIKPLDNEIYQAIHVKQIGLYDLDSIGAFVASKGVDRAKFVADYNSFTVSSDIVRAKQMIRTYGIEGTPTLIVDGKYKITGMEPAETLIALNEVISMVRKERKEHKH